MWGEGAYPSTHVLRCKHQNPVTRSRQMVLNLRTLSPGPQLVRQFDHRYTQMTLRT